MCHHCFKNCNLHGSHQDNMSGLDNNDTEDMQSLLWELQSQSDQHGRNQYDMSGFDNKTGGHYE